MNFLLPVSGFFMSNPGLLVLSIGATTITSMFCGYQLGVRKTALDNKRQFDNGYITGWDANEKSWRSASKLYTNKEIAKI